MNNNLHEHFRHYRGGGIALSATLITLSSALLVWGQQKLHEAFWASIFQLIFLALTVLACLTIQFFNYQGFKYLARSFTNQSTKERSDFWFGKEDFAVYASLALFIVGLLLSAVIYLTSCSIDHTMHRPGG
jgi:uncharacterized membrane protein YedE/YeeE